MTAFKALIAASTVLASAGAACATDLEVTHWWTSGGEAAAVAEFAKAFDATGNHWVDGAIAGSGGTARPIMVSRITGGDPMGATQFNHGRQAEELVQAGLMRDLTDLADQGAVDGGHPAQRACSTAAPSTARSTACRSTSTPGSGCGCPTQAFAEGRRAGAEELGRVRRRGAGAGEGRHHPARCRRQAWQSSGAFDVLMVGDRRQGHLPQGL